VSVINDCLRLFYTSSYTNALGVLRFGITKAMSLKPIDQLIHSALRQYACPQLNFVMVFGSKGWQSKIRGVLFESFEQSPIGSERFGFSSIKRST
jgi:hypothetical protein